MNSIVEVKIQIEDISIGVIVQPLVINVEGEVPKSNDALKRGVMQNILSHRIGILKRISQDAHNAFTNLQVAKHVCNEAVAWLDPIF